jgi:hypothetical protein
MSITAIEIHGNSVTSPVPAAKAAAHSEHFPAGSNRHGEGRSALEASAEDVGPEAAHEGATFVPPSSRCSRNVLCTATRSSKSSPSGRMAYGR